MSFEVRNDQQSLGQFASNNGYVEFAQAVKTPALRALVQHGASEDLSDVLEELDVLISVEKDPDVVSTAKALKDLIRNEDLIIISSGVSNSDEVSKYAETQAQLRPGADDRRQEARGGEDPRSRARSLRRSY